MNQRLGRVDRSGQKGRCINVINLVAKNSIEEKILTGIQHNTRLFDGVFDGATDAVEFSRGKRTELLNQMREMMGEEPQRRPRQGLAPEEIPEDTPHYLDPEVVQHASATVDITTEEESSEDDIPGAANGSATDRQSGNALAGQSPEKIEAILNSGMQFLGGLLEMATGRKLSSPTEDGRMLSIDRRTGEVTLKFKMPGF
jgi:hypothetical protein